MRTPSIPMPSPPYLPGTQLNGIKVALIYNAGGIGDYIHWTKAIQYVIKTHPHIHGHVLAPPFFIDLARLWLEGFDDRFEVRPITYSPDGNSIQYPGDCAVICPDAKQLVNATGFHLFSLGFYYYNQSHRIPREWVRLPEIRGDEVSVEKCNLPHNYAVLTPFATADNRKLSSECLNAMKDYLLKRGITPVYLGRRVMSTNHVARVDEGLDLTGVRDLRDMTTLPEAACIMAKARLVAGLDNGLLHLASCSSVPVVFAFTSVDPGLRLPPRTPGAQTITVTPPENLTCRFCNSNVRYYIGHDFKECMYKTNPTLNNLCATSLSGEVMIEAMERILGGIG